LDDQRSGFNQALKESVRPDLDTLRPDNVAVDSPEDDQVCGSHGAVHESGFADDQYVGCPNLPP